MLTITIFPGVKRNADYVEEIVYSKYFNELLFI